MIKKQTVKSRNVCKVTFELSDELSSGLSGEQADEVHLLAEFNGWQPIPFEKAKAGKWKLTQELEPGRDYEFRYMIVSGGERHFVNDEEADRTVPNDQGTENAVISC